MDLKSILKNKNYNEPPEVEAIKLFVEKHYEGRTVDIKVTPNAFIITTGSGAFASSLYSKIQDIRQLIKSDKQIYIKAN